MRFHKSIRLILLLLCLAFLPASGVSAEETKPQDAPSETTPTETPETDPSETEEPETEANDPSRLVVKVQSGKKYLCYENTGKKVKGLLGIQEFPEGSGNHYYFRSTSGWIHSGGWFRKTGKSYHAAKNGVLDSGWKTYSKKTYYFDPKTFVRSVGWKQVNKIYYYFDINGVQATGWLNLDTHQYYLDPKKNGARTVGWKKINKVYYYFNSAGEQISEWLHLGDYHYYLNPAKDGARSTGWTQIGTKYYYFDSKGRLQIGLLTIGGKKYYCDTKDGSRKTGLLTINGKKYYFDKKTGAMIVGWKTISGKKYYFSANKDRYGEAVTNWRVIDKYYYYFNSNGVMQKGWLTLGNKKYYLNPSTGRMTTGKAKIGGVTYDFGEDGAIDATPTGAWSVRVNETTNVVTVYRGDTPVKAMLCSVGVNGTTPTGTRYIVDKLRWHELMGPSYGQYCSHLCTSPTDTWSDYLFHSVLYTQSGNIYSLAPTTYNELGTAASHGCIRLSVASAKYLYDNCPKGTKVTIFYGNSANDPLGKPSLTKIPSNQTWDPTDPAVQK